MDNTKPKEISESEEVPDVAAIMARIREDVRKHVAENGSVVPTYRKTIEPRDGAPILYSEELNYLNAHWQDWAAPTEISSHRPIIGPIIVKFKKALVDIAWNYLLKGYFERERQFQMHLVKLLNATARYIDARDKELFWQLVGKIDNEIVSLNERADRLFSEATASTATLEINLNDRVSKLEGDRDLLTNIAARVNHDIGELDDIIRGVETSIVSLERKLAGSSSNVAISDELLGADLTQSKKTSENPNENGIKSLLDAQPRVGNHGFDNRFRGSQEAVKERMQDLVPFFTDLDGIVVDIGCGRGEFLELLRDAGVSSLGIDSNETMVSRCKEKGLNVICEETLSYLETVAPRSIGGVCLSQIVEHLSFEKLEELFSLLSAKVRPGGRVLVETINPQSLRALSTNFYRDPTHTRPQHPDTLRYMMELSGLRTEKVMMRSPFPAQTKLKPVILSEYLPPRWRSTLLTINENISRLNDILFGFQHYAIVSVVDAPRNIAFGKAFKGSKRSARAQDAKKEI